MTEIKMIYLFIWMMLAFVIGAYYSFQALQNRKEEYLVKIFRIMMTPIPFDKKYFTEKGLEYRKKALMTSWIGLAGFIIIVIIISTMNQ